MSTVHGQAYGTGQLPLLPEGKPVAGVKAVPAVSPEPAPVGPAAAADYGSYAAAGVPAASLSFSPPAQLLTQAAADFESLSGPEREQLSQLAAGLGFPNARTLIHALRKLPSAELTPWLRQLPARLPQAEGGLSQAMTGLAALARKQIEALAQAESLPLPRFEGDPARWDAASYLSVFNSLREMQAGLPAPVFKKLVAAEGLGLVFVREGQPPVENRNSLMQVLSGCMCIAHTNGLNRVTLYDPALSMDPATILNRSEVKDFLAGLNQKEPSPEAVKSLVGMLNLALPASRRLDPAAGLDAKLFAALADFEAIETLKQALDIVADDQKLPPTLKKQREAEIKAMLRELRAGSLADASAPLGLLEALDQPEPSAHGALSGSGRERLASLRQGYAGLCSFSLQPRQLELLVRNWFGILDSGNRLDFAEQVINHELGHIYHEQDQLLADWSQISFKDFDNQPNAEFMGETLRPQAQTGGFSAGFGSDYARVNPEEDFAESFRLFTRAPARLAEANPLKFVFLAGATGAYEGREAELVKLLREQGCSELKLRAMTCTLRGQTAAVAAQHAHHLLGLVDKLAHAFFIPSNLADAGASAVARIAASQTPRFDLRAATMLPGLEQALGMQGQNLTAVHPSQPGYVLDWLSERQRALADPAAAAAARAQLERFAAKGLEVFEPALRAQLPREVKALCAKSESRAVMLVLAQIQAEPARLGSWSQGLQKVGDALDAKPGQRRLDSSRRLSAARLEELLGKELVASLPAAFRQMLREPGLLERMSGYFGQIRLDSGLLLAEVDERLASQAEALKQAIGDLRNPKESNVLLRLALSGFVREGDQIVLDELQIGVQESLSQLYQRLREGLGIELDFSEATGQEILEAIRQGLNRELPAATEMKSSNPAYLERLRELLTQELIRRQPELQLVLEEAGRA